MVKISVMLWLLFFILIGCAIIIGPSVISVKEEVRRPVLENNDTGDNIDWIEWDK